MTPEFMELYKQTFETWRFQIESYWTRNTYFAGFETAALGADWLISANHHWTAAFGALIACLFAIVWIFSCQKQQGYIRYWWSKLIEFDRVLRAEGSMQQRPPTIELASDFDTWREARRGKRGPRIQYEYSQLVLIVPALFVVMWVYLFGFNWNALARLHWPH